MEPSAVRRGYVDGPWGQVHYRTAGTTGPVVVMFHESPTSSAVYEPVLRLLGSDCRVYAFDTPGYGASDPPPVAQEIPDYARALLAAIDGLGLEELTLVGSHTGAGLALQVAAQAGRARTVSAVLSGIPLYTDAERDSFLATWAPPQHLHADGSHLGWSWERFRDVWGESIDLAQLHDGVVDLLRVLPRYDWAYNASFRHPVLPDLVAMTAPTRVLAVEHDMLVEMDRRAVTHLADGHLVVVPDLPGQLSLRAPEVLAVAVREMTGLTPPPPTTRGTS